jgi:pentatricopeptide repeat protein
MQNRRATTQMYNSILNVYANDTPGRPDDAYIILKFMESGNCSAKPDIVSYATQSPARWPTRGALPTPRRWICSYSTVINAFANATPGRPDDVEEALRRMVAVGIQPNAVTYNSVIKAYAHATPVRALEAEQVLKTMQASPDAQPDTIS